MRNLDEALTEISSIRRQVAQSTEFRGYGPATLAATGALAIVAAAAQGRWLPEPSHHIAAYLGLWFSVAVLSLSAWTMGVSYGVGQLLVACVLLRAANDRGGESGDEA